MSVTLSARLRHPPGFRAARGLNWGALGVLYASYYMARYNFRFATPGMVEEFGFDVAGITQIFVVWSLAYGTGQLVNGLLADRIGGKTSMLVGAAGTIVCNFIFGFSSFVGTLATFGLIAILNGWFQSCGAPGMIKINAAWFARQERGTFSGIFGIMIQLGQYAINTLAPFLLGGFTVGLWFLGTWVVEPGTWRVLFIIPPFVTAAAAVFMALTVKEEPAAAGFPGAIKDELDDSAGTRVSLKESFTTIFTHPLVWFYAAAYACTGAVRHSSDQLSVLFFTQQLGIDMKARPLSVLIILNLMTTTAILGSVLSGWVSDRFFAGHRSPVARFLYLLEAGVISLAALMMFSGLIQPGLFGVTLAGIFLVLVSLTVNSTHSVVGAAAPMDIGGKKMAGFAAGVIDSFQYYGSALCLFISGLLIKKFGWGAWYPVMILFALGGALAMHHVRKVQLHHKNSPNGDPRVKNS